jgi:NTE family protein
MVKRSLVLAGGGMRVAWQTGVVRALSQAGLEFQHLDGTSGGIMTAGMMLSGQTPGEMGRRWSSLDVKNFSSLLPLGEYLGGPWDLPALGDADGLLNKVFPGLGIDAALIRSSTVEGSFNLVDFVTKQCVAVPHTEVDAELLAAGMSLPIFMPPLRRGDHVWTDAVWVKDANIGEALRRGADEVWLVWCIGNTPYWGDGPLEQYVHMIEMSANGALFAELAVADREFVLHVVKPRYPLPLDPEFFIGRISADTLIDMGYRDGWDYLAQRQPGGVSHDATCTAMTQPSRGVRFTERLRGEIDGSDLTLQVTVELPLPRDGTSPGARLVGHVDYQPWGERVLLAHGRVSVDGPAIIYRARVLVDGAWLPVVARRELLDDRGFDAWADMRTVEFSVGSLSGTLRFGVLDAGRTLASLEPVGTHGFTDRKRALAYLAELGLRRAFETY